MKATTTPRCLPLNAPHTPIISTAWRWFAPVLALLLLPLTLTFNSGCDDTADTPDADEDLVSIVDSNLTKGTPGAAVGQSNYCADPANRCAVGEGRCVGDAQCQPGLICAADLGTRYGITNPDLDVCTFPHCVNGALDPDLSETGLDCGGPCGFCDRPPTWINGNSAFCSKAFPCDRGQGTCAPPIRPCGVGLVCAEDWATRYGLFKADVDVCTEDHCVNGTFDPALGETALDCGGPCGLCERPVAWVNGSSSFCSTAFPCGHGQGNCEPPLRPCEAGLVCRVDAGAAHGLKPTVDVCDYADCTPETDEAFCARMSAECGVVAALDNCGHSRTRDCGSCPFGECLDHACGCAPGACEPVSDAALCGMLHVACGPATGKDNCDADRTVANCGACAGGTACVTGACVRVMPFVEIVSGGAHSCALRADGSVTCWGSNANNQLTPPTGALFRTLEAGEYQTCGIKLDGTIACWGRNDYGQSTAPVGTYKHLSTGYMHSCAVREDGAAVCWGDSSLGRTNAPAGTYIQLTSGDAHTCGILTSGDVVCWGWNTDGQATPPEGKFAHIAAGGFHTCGIRNDGELLCWGDNDWGQSAPPAGKYIDVSVGDLHSCGVRVDGTVACWGTDLNGRTAAPTGIYRQVAAGNRHTCALRTDTSIACWGCDCAGQTVPPLF